MRLKTYRATALKMFVFLFALLALPLFMGCEKDDICVDGDTPLLVIRFYDMANPGTPKAINRLRVVGAGQADPVDTFTDRSNLDSIAIPLRLDAQRTSFAFIQDSEDSDGQDLGNPDTLHFDYELLEVYVSRACGFVGQYEGLSATLEADGTPWIDSVHVNIPSVTNMQLAHVSIFH